MAAAVCEPACTAELMRIGHLYHEPPDANMLILRDTSASSTWSAGYNNTLHLHRYTPRITCPYYIICTHLGCFCTLYSIPSHVCVGLCTSASIYIDLCGCGCAHLRVCVSHLYIYILVSVYMNMLYKCNLDFHIQYQQRHYTHYLGSGQMCNQLYTGVARI